MYHLVLFKQGMHCSVMPSSHTLLVYKFSVLINGSKQFSSSCKYIFLTWDPIHWCDLQCKAEAIFSEHEWNEVEILSELKPTHMFGREIVNWTLFGVYEEGNNKEDIEFKNPMSIFLFHNREPFSSLPSCLYYYVSYWRNDSEGLHDTLIEAVPESNKHENAVTRK